MVSMSVCVSSCEKDPGNSKEDAEALSKFMLVDSPSIYIEGELLTEFDKEKEQISYTEDKREYMVSNLAFDKLFTLKINSTPELNSNIRVECTTIGLNDFAFNDKSMKVVKVEDSMIWIWDRANYTGIVLKFYE